MIAERAREPWSWKSVGVDDPETVGMLYEPGNWGDVLKGTWVLRVLEHVGAAKPTTGAITYVDPFAGAPTYPLSPGSATRLRRVSETVFGALQAPHIQRGRVASTAALVADAAARMGRTIALKVFDLDETRRAAWSAWSEWGDGSVEILAGATGDAAIKTVLERGSFSTLDSGLVLIDPYDFFDHWGGLLKSAAAMACTAPVLIYLYNKSPRSPGHREQYRRLRQAVESAAPIPGGVVFGRVPSDASAPRAHHEMVLLGAEPTVEALRERLEEDTRELISRISGRPDG